MGWTYCTNMSPGTCIKQMNQYLLWFPLCLPHLILTCRNLGKKGVLTTKGSPITNADLISKVLQKAQEVSQTAVVHPRPSRHIFQNHTRKWKSWQTGQKSSSHRNSRVLVLSHSLYYPSIHNKRNAVTNPRVVCYGKGLGLHLEDC